MKNKCIVCGRRARRIKMPAGSLCLCKDRRCLDTVLLGINGSIPVTVFNMADLENHEVVHEEIVEAYKDDVGVVRELARDVENYIWAGETLGEMFHDALVDAGQKLEKIHIENNTGTNLLTIPMSMLHSEEAKQLLESKLKGSQS